jgi:hypothetical protein
MIRYALKCTEGHGFESWFSSSASFEMLRDAGHLACAVCGATDVDRAMMAPNVAPKGAGAAQPASQAGPSVDAHGPSAAEETGAVLSGPASPLEAAIRALRAKIEANAENVGRRFADEARAIHDGAADARPIFGEATKDEARALIDEGVEIAPLPWTTRRDS